MSQAQIAVSDVESILRVIDQTAVGASAEETVVGASAVETVGDAVEACLAFPLVGEEHQTVVGASRMVETLQKAYLAVALAHISPNHQSYYILVRSYHTMLDLKQNMYRILQ